MPRIDPLELLKCLSVLLSPSGGIRSANEVERVARLMSRYSKKLVSKCIYVQVLKSTSSDVLDLFLKEGGWGLVVNWFQDAVQTSNYPLVLEVLQLLQHCPINADRLKDFDNGLIKRLAMESSDIVIRTAASQVWSVWFPHQVNASMGMDNLHMGAPQPDLSDALPTPDDMALLNDLFPSSLPFDPSFTFPSQPSGGLDAENVFDLSNIDPSFTFDGMTASQYHEPLVSNAPAPIAPTSSTLAPIAVPEPVPATLPVLKIVTRDGKYSVTESEGNSTAPDPKGKTDKSKSEKGHSQSSSKSKQRDSKSHKSDKSKDGRKSSSSNSSRDRDKKSSSSSSSKSSKDSSKSKPHKSSSKPSTDKSKEVKQAEKDKETLATLKALTTPGDGLPKLAKIPRKIKTEGDEEVKINSSDPNFDPLALLDKSKPKTVKTFNSKFRSTGLEDGSTAKPGLKKTASAPPPMEKKPLPPAAHKRPPEMNIFASLEKKIKPAMLLEKKDENAAKREEKGGIKLIAPRPRPAVLQDSSLFGDALDAGAKAEPRRKRRRSSDSKKDVLAPMASPTKKTSVTSSPTPQESAAVESASSANPVLSPTVVKPQLKFYQDTLETPNAEEEKWKVKDEDDLEMPVLTKETDDDSESKEEAAGETKIKDEATEEEETIKNAEDEEQAEKGPGVLLITTQTRTKPKKTLRWREEEDLLQFHYFELDETERVNVNKMQFGDMKQADRKYEREAVERARRMVTEDVMEEKQPWKALVHLNLPERNFISGANSREKDIQEARESSTLQALFFNRQMLPDSPAEPDIEVPLERPADPIAIPFDDVTGNPESVYDNRHIPWPEPKVTRPGFAPEGFHGPPQQQPRMMDLPPPTIPTIPVMSVGPMGQPHMMGPNVGGPPLEMVAPSQGPPRGGGWMAGDGSVFPDTDNRFPYDDGRGFPPHQRGMMPDGDMGGAGNYGGYDEMEMDGRNFVHMNPSNMPMGPRGMGMGMDNGPRFRGGPGFGPGPGMGPRRPGPPMGGPPQGMGPRGMNPNGISACWHFMRGYCRMESKCKFLHPGFPV